MDKKEIFNRIEYVVACVGVFAQRYNLSNMQAYAYLRRFTGIDFLLDCYAAEHTLSIDNVVSDLQVICQREGGKIWQDSITAQMYPLSRLTFHAVNVVRISGRVSITMPILNKLWRWQFEQLDFSTTGLPLYHALSFRCSSSSLWCCYRTYCRWYGWRSDSPFHNGLSVGVNIGWRTEI